MIKLALAHNNDDIAFTAAPSIAQDNHWRDIGVHIRTIDDLDRPQDGWCLDAVGSGPIRFDMPLVVIIANPDCLERGCRIYQKRTNTLPTYENACVTVMSQISTHYKRITYAKRAAKRSLFLMPQISAFRT